MIKEDINISKITANYPECMELLHPFRSLINCETTISNQAENSCYSTAAFVEGIERYIQRSESDPINFDEIRNKIIKPNHVNIAGFVNFLWQKELVDALKRHARENDIILNINLFPKHQKKIFQNYLANCHSADQLPEILVGKGFSSLMTKQFIDRFVLNDIFQHTSPFEKISPFFIAQGLKDEKQHYHPFAVEEMVLIRDRSIPLASKNPESWSDLLSPAYSNSIMQMGKNKRDHFGFNIMLQLYCKGGEKMIEKFAVNVKNKQHFSYIIKNIASKNEHSAPINVVHQFASLFIRSDARDQCSVIKTSDGNPVNCHFFLLKKEAPKTAIKMAKYFYSDEVKQLISQSGSTHTTASQLFSGSERIQWVGWDTIKHLPLPFLKDHLSKIAFDHYQS